MQSKTHESVLFERSEFTGECAELPNESSKLCTAARRCRGYRGNPPVLLFFCRHFLFQTKRKCRNAGSIYYLIIVRSEGRKWILQFYFVPLSRQRCVESPHPTMCLIDSATNPICTFCCTSIYNITYQISHIKYKKIGCRFYSTAD